MIEDYPCACKNDLKLREIHYINTIPCINKNKPFISNYVINGIDNKEWARHYRNNHVDKMKSYYIAHSHELKIYQVEYQKNYKIIQQTKQLFLALPFHQVLQ